MKQGLTMFYSYRLNAAAMDGGRNHHACNYPRITPFQAACYESWWKIGND